jgi:molecular chaperone DnaJ
MADQINYYEVLGVPRNASQSEIKNAYRKHAKERHPDRPGGSETEFSRLQEAHAVLSDPNRRRQHDEALDLAHAADQLAGVIDVDWNKLEDELSQKRRERESHGGGDSGPGLGERLRNRFRREDTPHDSGGRAEPGRSRYRAPTRQARWYEPHDFDPEPVTWKTGALSFVGAFLAFIVIGQIGRWTVGIDRPPNFGIWALALNPFVMWFLYALVGLVAAYFAYRAAGWAGIALVFVAALIVGGSGGTGGLVQFATAGILMLLAAIYLGQRRASASWRDRR